MRYTTTTTTSTLTTLFACLPPTANKKESRNQFLQLYTLALNSQPTCRTATHAYTHTNTRNVGLSIQSFSLSLCVNASMLLRENNSKINEVNTTSHTHTYTHTHKQRAHHSVIIFMDYCANVYTYSQHSLTLLTRERACDARAHVARTDSLNPLTILYRICVCVHTVIVCRPSYDRTFVHKQHFSM